MGVVGDSWFDEDGFSVMSDLIDDTSAFYILCQRGELPCYIHSYTRFHAVHSQF